MPIIHVLPPLPRLLVDDRGQRYVARACAAARLDGEWDRWFIFLPFGYGLPLTTERETVHGTLPGVKSWAEAMTTANLQAVFRQARAPWPEALLARGGRQAA